MENQNPSFTFPLLYADNEVSCEVIMQLNSYDVLFDGQWMASVEHTEDWNWIQASGIPITEDVVDEIGFKIESEYK